MLQRPGRFDEGQPHQLVMIDRDGGLGVHGPADYDAPPAVMPVGPVDPVGPDKTADRPNPQCRLGRSVMPRDIV